MLSRSSIDEANRHLYAMHQQIQSLEGMIQQQNQELLDRDQQLVQLEENKNREIQTLKKRVQQLEEEAEVRESSIQDLKGSVSHLQSVLQFLPCVRGLLKEMEHSAAKTSQENSLSNHTDSHTDEAMVNHSNSVSPGNVTSKREKEYYF
ncbi:uncharacterized protein LOC133200947 [Saccostrea echinata]|uniref:uncharacterized protein LOC133200947 n=1 Tax=Saccostrea echinata TaxID=191078 RepID=UPI002A7EBA76|nr:uncharacterized protein LOC133200947 [Saccostrea echinata]